MARADDYRRYAAECLALAQRAKTPHDRVRLLEMAHDWNEMALKAGQQEPQADFLHTTHESSADAPHNPSQDKSPYDEDER